MFSIFLVLLLLFHSYTILFLTCQCCRVPSFILMGDVLQLYFFSFLFAFLVMGPTFLQVCC